MTVGVFDLGGVLYEFAGRQILDACTALPDRGRTGRLAEWAALPCVRDFERGRTEVAAFATAVVETFRLSIAPAEFVRRFEDAARGFYPGALELVMGSGFTAKVTLSNTNSLQWPRVQRDLARMDPFDRHFPSHVIGHHKPAAAAFECVMSQFPGEDFVFFDDRQDNVEAARHAGMKAYRVSGVDELRVALARAGRRQTQV